MWSKLGPLIKITYILYTSIIINIASIMGLVGDIHRAREKFLSNSVVIYDNLNYVKLLNVINVIKWLAIIYSEIILLTYKLKHMLEIYNI